MYIFVIQYIQRQRHSRKNKGEMKMKITNNLKKQINEMIRKNETIVNIINFLFTCDYSVEEVAKILVNEFGCKEQLVRDVFWVDFGMDGIGL